MVAEPAIFPEVTLQDIEKAAQSQFLSLNGTLHVALEGVQTMLLLGPLEPGFWAHFTASDEYRDGQADPLDRWSERVISDLANAMDAQAFFPFGGPPYQPFTQWARGSGQAHVSPVGLLVHDRAGLWLSYRGALGLKQRLDLPDTLPSPCLSCEKQPCITACPVDALKPDIYDVAACKADLERPENHCMSKGCAVRRACPVSQNYGRNESQSAFHMEAFK
jgi:ferredoxin